MSYRAIISTGFLCLWQTGKVFCLLCTGRYGLFVCVRTISLFFPNFFSKFINIKEKKKWTDWKLTSLTSCWFNLDFERKFWWSMKIKDKLQAWFRLCLFCIYVRYFMAIWVSSEGNCLSIIEMKVRFVSKDHLWFEHSRLCLVCKCFSLKTKIAFFWS